jgi:predicted site-specific integrase-resolvase
MIQVEKKGVNKMAVAPYARVSTAKQAEKDLSIPDQLWQIRD